ncbi:MAG: hypothetical protein LUD47_06775 [Clostridia bacterium]|nr:hypothetical protein [Clostridia bacterium]
MTEECPVYMSMGMSYVEYWDGDIYAAAAYRKADEYRRARANEDAWLAGLYNMRAFASVMGAALGKKGQKSPEYPKEPYPVTQAEKDAAKERSIKKTIEFFRKGEEIGRRNNPRQN